MLLNDTGLPGDAVPVFIKAYELSKNPSIIFYLASAYIKLGNAPELGALLKQATEDFGNNKPVLEKINLLKKRVENFI